MVEKNLVRRTHGGVIWLGDSGNTANANDPDGFTHNGPYLGLGIKL